MRGEHILVSWGRQADIEARWHSRCISYGVLTGVMVPYFTLHMG
jgi:hypothetical protein